MNLFELFAKIILDTSDYEEGIKKSENKISDFAGKLKTGIGNATKVVAGAGAVFSGMAVAGVAALNSIAESTEEYRIAMGKLNTAYEAAGLSQEAANTAYTEFYKILGETDTATEASQLLAQLTENEEDLAKWTNIAAGVSGTFGDSLPVESLIEATNETAKVGQVTGTLADALNWVGISEDEFNAKLAECSDESERNQLIMETLSAQYEDAAESFYKNNEAIVKARENQALLDASLAKIGESITVVKNNILSDFIPSITAFADVISNVLLGEEYSPDELMSGLESFSGAFENVLNNILDLAVTALPIVGDMAIQVILTFVSTLISKLPDVIQSAAQIILSLANGIAEALPELLPSIVDVVIQIAETLTNPDTLNNLVEAALAIILALSGGLVDAIPKLLKAVPVIIGNLVQTIIEAVPKLIFAAGELVLGLITGLNSPDNSLALVEGTIRMLGSIIAGIISYYKQLFEKGKEIFTSIKKGFMTFIDDPKKWGKDLIDNFISGVKEKFGALKNAVIDVGNTIRDYIGFSEPKYGPLSDFHTYAPDMMELFIQGIQSKKEDLKGELFDLADAVSEIFNGIKESASVLLDVSSLEYELWEKTYDASNTSLYIAEQKLKDLEETLKAQSEAVKAAEEAYKNAKSETEKYQTEQRLAREQEQYDEIQKSIDAVNEELERLNDQSATDKYRKQLGMLTDQQKEQKNIVDAAIEAYNQVVSEYGEASSESLKYQKQLLQEKIAYQELTASIQEATRALAELQQKGGLTDVYSLENYVAPIGSMTRTAQAYPNNQQQMIVNNVETTVELDGAVLARNMYTYTQNEANRRGTSLVY